MKPFLLLALLASSPAQKKIDDAMANSCALAKKNVTAQATVCADENAKLAALDCADKAARSSEDFLRLNVECMKKVRDAARAGQPAPAKEEKKGSRCKVLDESGAVVAEHDSEGSPVKCQGEIREKVRAAKCAPNKKLTYQYVPESGKPIAMIIGCPAK